MTPQEFLLEKFQCDLVDFDILISCVSIENHTSTQIFKWMNEYAKIMCQKQKEICAEEVELFEEGFFNRNDDPDYRWVVNRDSILNSPLPNELQDEI